VLRLLPTLVLAATALTLVQPAAAQESPSPVPQPTATATPHSDCAQGAPLRPYGVTITAQQQLELTASAPAGARIRLVATDAQAGSRTVRTGTADDQGQVAFAVRPVVNTTFSADQDPEPCTSPVFGQASNPVQVRTALSLEALRSGTRDYSFGARAGQVVRR
jgi:hypothetical protein